MDFSIGSSACHIAVSQIQKRKAVDVELYINDDKELFKSLFAHKDEIEKNMEMELEWKELPERKASRILIEKTVDLDGTMAVKCISRNNFAVLHIFVKFFILIHDSCIIRQIILILRCTEPYQFVSCFL